MKKKKKNKTSVKNNNLTEISNFHPLFIMDFLTNGRGKWTQLYRTPNYPIKCARLIEPINHVGKKFKYNITKFHWSLGPIFISLAYPLYYPGKKETYCEVCYLTKEGLLYCDIVVFKTKTELTQRQIRLLYIGLLETIKRSSYKLAIDSKWDSSFLFRDYFDLLNLSMHERLSKKLRDEINLNLLNQIVNEHQL